MATSTGFVSYFGAELRRHRERMGWQREELAERVPWSVWTVTSVEQGRRKPPPGLGEHLDALFNLPGVLTALAQSARDDRTPFGDRLDLEQRAVHIREYDHRVVPGLLQTRAYADAVNRSPGDGMSDEEIKRAIDTRLSRQRILDGDHPTVLHAVIDEAVLCRRIGDSQGMREQFLALTTRRSNITVQVLPFSAGAHDSLVGPLSIMRIPDEPDVAYTDGWAGGQVIDTPAEVLRVQQAFEQLVALALPPTMSAEMIQAYAEET